MRDGSRFPQRHHPARRHRVRPADLRPQAFALLCHSRFDFQIYESLVGRKKRCLAGPALAFSWSMPSPSVQRLKLRPGVLFHDRSPMTADDVVFRWSAPTRQLRIARSSYRA